MKKLFLYSILSLASTSLFAQEIKIAPVFGLHAATTLLSSESKNQADDLKSHPTPGITIGALGEYSLFDNLNVRSGLLLSVKGGKFKYTDQDSGYTIKFSDKITLTYLELPLWVSYPIGESGFSLVGGPAIGFALGAKIKSKMNYEGDVDIDVDKLPIGNDPYFDYLKPIDISLNLGVAKQIDIADKTFEVSFNIQPSLSKYNTASKNDSGFWSRNMVIGLRAAYFFSLSR